MGEETIVVLGVGNTLMRDDGIGVRAVEALRASYEVPETVRAIEGGVAAFAWIEALSAARCLVIVDAVCGNGPPGAIVRLTPEHLARRNGPTISAHEVGVPEILGMVALLGRLPPTVILGVQPAITDVPGLELTDALQHALPHVCAAIVDELRALQVKLVARQSPDSG